MLRTILVGLDGSEHSAGALKLAMEWAKRLDALLVGMGCVDEPGIHGPGEHLMGEVYFDRLNMALLAETRTRIEATLSQAALRCAEAGVAFKPLEDTGTPYVQILQEAQRYDLIVLGRQTHFRFGWDEEPDVTLSKVLADSPRPVVAVPDDPGDGKSVVVAYDGSLQAARALSSFETSGLGQGRKIHVASIAESTKDAARRADRAVDFLKSHGLDAVPYPIESGHPPAEVLLETIRRCDPGLLVMGAYGQPVLREFFLGSTTRTMLERCPVPMFLDH
jgi:nucleotide-binding universal stress UspA family protein